MPLNCDHPCQQPPLGKELSLWRYMSFAQFVFLVASKQLYFRRADKLDDRMEGAIPRRLQEDLEGYYSKHGLFGQSEGTTFHNFYQQEIMPRRFVSCWHQNNVESAGMWALYGKTRESVTVKTTIGRLQDSLHDEPQAIDLCNVEYYDDHSNWTPPSDVADKMIDPWLSPFLIKRKSFEHEKEVRAIVSWRSEPWRSTEPITDAAGYEAVVNLQSLIEQVYVAPRAKQWFVSVVKSVVSQFGLDNGLVKKSSMDDNLIG